MDQNLLSELKVSAPLINDQISDHSSRYAYHGSLASEAAKNARDARTQAEVVEAQIINLVRSNWPEGEGRRSEWVTMAMVRSDPRWAEAWNNYHEAKRKSDLMQVTKEAFMQRKDLLVTMAANLRGEMGGQVRLNTQPAYLMEAGTDRITVQEEEEDLGAYVEKSLTKPSSKGGSNFNKLQQTFHQQQLEKQE